MPRNIAITPVEFTTFGELLRFLRRKAKLTQRELAIAVGYSESQISRLEKNERAPDEATLAARFVPALYLEEQPEWTVRFLELGAEARSTDVQDEPAKHSHNLPIPLTNFFGREKEINEIKRLLGKETRADSNTRLLTLIGHGGCGKTRLALQIAFDLLPDFEHGIWLIEFAPLTDSDLMTNTLAGVLGVAEEPNGDLMSALIEYLRDKSALLIFDNCEHLVQASAELAETLLQNCPDLHILATSREMLGVSGERAMNVPSLSMPDRKRPTPPGQLAQFESVQLFVDRATNVISDFKLTPANEIAVSQICQQLDGIPLAIELAAARLRMMPVEQIASRLDDAFRLLTGGSRTALPRHQTLQASIDWSYELLTNPEKTLFRRLAVFARGWTLNACEAICSGDDVKQEEVVDLLSNLLDKSLVLKRTRIEGHDLRYRLFDTLRQYAMTKLIESGEADTIRRKHAEYYFNLAEAGAPKALSDFVQKNWLESVEVEINNVRAALTWSLSNMTNDAAELRMDRKGGIRMSAWALNRLGWMARERGDTVTARPWLEQSLSIYRELDDKLGIAWTTVTLGEALNMNGDLRNARSLLEEGLTLARQQGEQQAIGWGLIHLGYNLLLQNDLIGANACYQESAAIFEAIGPHKAGLGSAHFGLGEVAINRKEPENAIRSLKNSMDYYNQYKNGSGLAWCAASMGAALSLKDEHEQAAAFWGMSDSLLSAEQKILRKPPINAGLHQELRASTRNKLGEERYKKIISAQMNVAIEQVYNTEANI